jgi:aspartyl-tRNA(Asn)/glutamyl-tRNA(Gln) amidotransferase subunit A
LNRSSKEPPAALDLELTALVDALANDEFAGQDLAAAAGDRARANAFLNCFIELFEAGGPGAARQVGPVHGNRPLHGVPFAVKDVFRWGGREPTGGSLFGDLLAGAPDSPVVDHLTALGAELVGATNLDEICYGMTGINPHFGPVRNPWGHDRIAGGSSSGAAAAVAARIVPFALASDTGGSIRVPAALCGVTGFKPTLGSLSTAGVVLLSSTQDSLGFIARTAADCALLMTSLADWPIATPVDGADSPPLLLRGLRVGVIRHPFFDGASPTVSEAFAAALEVFRAGGASIGEVTSLDLDGFDADAAVITGFEAARYHGLRIEQQLANFSGPSRIRLEAARTIEPDAYARAVKRHRALIADPPEALAQWDVLVSPTALDVAPRIDTLAADASASVAYTISLLRCTRPFNYLGGPTVSVPMGRSPEGLPMGLQIVGAVGSDARALAVAESYQRLTSWHRVAPAAWGGGNARSGGLPVTASPSIRGPRTPA